VKNKQQKRDWRYDVAHDGILYPRVRGLGGCSAHHAMIFVRPNDHDWNPIAAVTGDTSWRASEMQKYWERFERCRSRIFIFLWRWLWRRIERWVFAAIVRTAIGGGNVLVSHLPCVLAGSFAVTASTGRWSILES
jgi:choline dehydrogenase-like flavoprotein